jgi:glycosyltransferase involved in cell wall biosynthesis
MRIIALPGDLSACGYYRVFAPLAALGRAGLADVCRPPATMPEGGGRPQILIRPEVLRDFDIAVFQRQPEGRITRLFHLARAFGTAIVFDLDDDVFSVPPTSPAYIAFGRDWRKIGGLGQCKTPEEARRAAAQARENFEGILRNLRLADLVTVSTERLRQVYGRYRNDIVVLPNQVEPRDWEDAISNPHPKPGDEIWIGWAGSKTHWADLAGIARPVTEVLRRHHNIRLVIVGFPEAARLFEAVTDQVVTFDWMPITGYRRIVAAFDIALAPSAPTQFNEAKSDIRVLEAALCGIPVVASETTYGDTVREAGCGFVAKTPQKWIKYLGRLIANVDLRREMGEKGREYVLGERTYDANAWRWAEAYSKIL